MQNIYRIKLVITKVFITVIIICGTIYISASSQDIKVRVNFETRHQHFAWKGFSMKKSYPGVKVIDFFYPQGFTKKKGKHSKLKNLIIHASSDAVLGFSGPEPCPHNKLTNLIIWAFSGTPQRFLVNLGSGTIPPPPPSLPKKMSRIYPNYRKTPKVGHQIIYAFCGAPQKFWVNLVWMATGSCSQPKNHNFHIYNYDSTSRDSSRLKENIKKREIRPSMPSPVYPKVCTASGSSLIKVNENSKQLYIWFVFIIPKVKTRRLAYRIESSDAKTTPVHYAIT